MASILEGAIAKTIAAGFRGKLLKGTLRRVGSATVDQYGDPVSGAAVTYAFEGIVDEYDDAYRAQAGIPQTDVKILIIAGSLLVEPTKEDMIKLRGRWYQARKITTDPAKATWTLQAFGVEAPTP